MILNVGVDASDLESIPGATGLAFALPVEPNLNSTSQSSSSLSSLSEGASRGTPSGKSKSASGHSSGDKREAGARMVAMAEGESRKWGQRDIGNEVASNEKRGRQCQQSGHCDA